MLRKSWVNITSAGLLAASGLAGCAATDPYTGESKISNAGKGAALGAGLGALSGLLVGGSHNAQRNAVLIGAGVGALGGGLIGGYMDSQEAELRAQLQGSGVSVSRSGNRIILNMPSAITFNTDQDSIKAQFYRRLDAVAVVLKKYNKSLIDVFGYTDSTGSAAHNQALSERRAASVGQYLTSQGIDSRRLAVVGYGAGSPVAANATAAGRALNRRVEIQISPLQAG